MALTIHYACFHCRKGFKRYVPFQRGEALEKAPCPQCHAMMPWMGRAFRAPRQNDVEQWRKVELLREKGIVFRGAGCQVMELLPRRLRDVQTFLKGLSPISAGARAAERSNAARRTKKRRHDLKAPPIVRILPEPGAAPFAKKTFKRLRIGGPNKSIDISLPGSLGSAVTLAWRRGPSLFLTQVNLPRHITLNGQTPEILPRQIHPGDRFTLGWTSFVLEW